MRKVLCDLCGREMTDVDTRYIEFFKCMEDDTRKNVHPALEICAICCEIAHRKVKDGCINA